MTASTDANAPDSKRRWFRRPPLRVLVGLLAFQAILLVADRRHWLAYRFVALLACGAVAAPFIPSLVRLAMPALVRFVVTGVRRMWAAISGFFRGRWYQFSLRSLLVFTLIFAVTVGWLGNKIAQKRRERQAVEVIVKAGGRVWFDQESNRDSPTRPNEPSGPRWLRWALGENFFSEVRQVDLRFDDDATLAQLDALREVQVLNIADGGKITDTGVAHINALPHLRSLTLYATSVTNQWLDHLKGVPKLRTLILDPTNIDDKSIGRITEVTQLEELFLHTSSVTDKGLENFERMTRLQKLAFRNAAITGAGLIHLKRLTKLEELFLMDTNVDDAGLESLSAMPGLRRLWLSGTKVTDAGLANLRPLSRLESLHLEFTRVTDAGLVNLKELSGLHQLALNGRQVTDAGLANLRDLEQLEDLQLIGTSVTADAADELRKSLPKCKYTR
jgi:internalin A